MTDQQPTDQPPDHLSVDPSSPFYNEAVLTRGIGIRFKGKERIDVEEYCVSENWIRAPVGKTRDRKGNLLTVRLTGPVEPYFLTSPPEA
jgi:Protein of unknown function (DUF3297)